MATRRSHLQQETFRGKGSRWIVVSAHSYTYYYYFYYYSKPRDRPRYLTCWFKLTLRTHARTQLFYGLIPGLPAWAGVRRNLLLDFIMQGTITEADTPTTQLGATPLISDPPPSSPHFYAGCPSCHNPSNLSWLGTGTKYAGLHTQWLGFTHADAGQIQRTRSKLIYCSQWRENVAKVVSVTLSQSLLVSSF